MFKNTHTLDFSQGNAKDSKPDPNLPHIVLANNLLTRGEDFTPPDTPEQSLSRKKSWGKRKNSITDPKQLPKGWSAHDLDVEEDDIDGQIKRCEERIAEGIMPEIFEGRLKNFKAIKEEQMAMIKSEPKGLDWEVIQRLHELKQLKANLSEEDKDKNLPNVEAIIKAYQTKQISNKGDLVTFWCDGKLVAGPKKFDPKELYALSSKQGPAGLWVEGINGSKPQRLNIFFSLNPPIPGYAQHKIFISLRNPNTQATNTDMQTLTVQCLEDTGATLMKLHDQDVVELERLSGTNLPIVGSSIMTTATALVTARRMVVQANIWHNGQYIIPRWVDIEACVSPSPPGQSHMSLSRLSGVWIHHMLTVLSLPDNTFRKHIGTNIYEILNTLVIPDPTLAQPPPIMTGNNPAPQGP
ncbi:unnamed protein product [Penicillium salamii]|nr:unnamed protein product [Penicillium salamii]